MLASTVEPIGVFDSGVGGLSVWKEIVRLLPNEPTIYVADSANCPYGEKSSEEIIQLAEEITIFLLDRNAKLIVVACNTVTAAAIDYLRSRYDVPFVGMEPAVKLAAQQTQTGNIGILATKGTLEGNHYRVTSRRHASHVKQHVQIGAGLVELVENGQLDGEATEAMLRKYLEPMMKDNIDQLVLGCTHYPFLIPAIKKIVGENITILDPAKAVARRVKNLLEQHQLLAPLDYQPSHLFFNSLHAETMQRLLAEIGVVSANVHVISIQEANAFYHSKKIYTTPSYRIIRDFYADKQDEQGKPLIQYVHEGIEILEKLRADERTQEAFCLCPIFQTDENLCKNYLKSFKGVHSSVIILAMEYRNIARQPLHDENLMLSPLREVNELLLVNYMQQNNFRIPIWAKKLGIDEDFYKN